MQLLTTLTLALLSASTSLAASVPSKFYLKTETYLGPNNHPQYNDLYLNLYDSGSPYQAVAALQPNKTGLYTQSLNSKAQIEFHLKDNATYGLVLVPPYDIHSKWWETQIIYAGGTRKFSFNKYGYLVNGGQEWVGWRVCRWVHGVPELFHNIKDQDQAADLPENCNQVNLVAVAA